MIMGIWFKHIFISIEGGKAQTCSLEENGHFEVVTQGKNIDFFSGRNYFFPASRLD